MAQDNNTNKFWWLTNEQKEEQIKHFKSQISIWEKKIKELEERKMKGDIYLHPPTRITSRRHGFRKRGRKPYQQTLDKSISSLKLSISNWLRRIKEIEDTM